MGDYTSAAEEVKQFFVRISAESVAINAKIMEWAGRLEGAKQGNLQWDAIVKESADGLELFARRVDELLLDYQRNLDLLTEGFVERNKSLDPASDAGAQELEGMRRKAQALAEIARAAQPKTTALRSISAVIRDSNHDPRLTQSAKRVITTSDNLLTAYEDLETFALKVSFSANPGVDDSS